MKTDTYFYIGKLSPDDSCRLFNPGEIPLENGWVLDIFAAGIHLWNPELDPKSYDVRAYAMETYNILVACFNFITKSNLKFVINNLIEAKGVRSDSNLIWGFYPDKYIKRPGGRQNKFNVAWKRVGKAFPKIRNSFYHRIILQDYQNCIGSSVDDRFFYAYRIIENVRRATTQHLKDFDDKEYWDDMHQILRTNKPQIGELIEVARKVRHGDFKDPVLMKARKNPTPIIESAYKIMEMEFRRSFKSLYDGRQFYKKG